jgi:quercetin dioxygenase-like cupin family protein
MIANEISVDTLVQSSTSWDGSAFTYVEEKPQITIQKITINPKGKELTLPLHCHEIPLAGYIVKGQVQVLKPSGETKIYKAGDAVIEVMNKWHTGVFTEETEIIAFYVGNEDINLTIKKSEDPKVLEICK